MSYVPASACGTGCLPGPHTVPQVGWVVAVARVLALVAVVVGGIGVAVSLPLLRSGARAAALRGWFRAVLASVGARLVTSGQFAAGGPALVTSNHLSWLDIPAILAVRPMRVLAKAELRRWPVLGYLATRGGTLFIDRARLRSLPVTVAQIAGVLRRGDSVLVFPEGSTWCGRTRGRYRPATMQAAIDAGVPVRPVTLRYLLDGDPTTVAAWVGLDTLLASVWRVASTRGLTVLVEAGPLVRTAGLTRREVVARVAAN